MRNRLKAVGQLLLLIAFLGQWCFLERVKEKEAAMYQTQQQFYNQPHGGQVFSTEAEILEYAESIKNQQNAEPTPGNSKYLNDDLTEEKKDDQSPDMSGLDDLADL